MTTVVLVVDGEDTLVERDPADLAKLEHIERSYRHELDHELHCVIMGRAASKRLKRWVPG